MLRKILRNALDESPRRNLTKLRDRLAARFNRHGAAPEHAALAPLLNSPALPLVMEHAVTGLGDDIVLAGDRTAFAAAAEPLLKGSHVREFREFTWDMRSVGLLKPDSARVVLCLVPMTEAHWERVAELKRDLGGRLILLTELLLPYTRIPVLQQSLDYFIKDTRQIVAYYLGREFFGPLQDLDRKFPLRGKSVIEFGPFDGCQTAGIVHLGASRVTCIEARAENAVKTAAAAEAFGWRNVRIAMDDFHNADATKYGRHDLAFAHGVYYHATAPFVFLENLCTLSDAIFLGGYCATDALPATPWQQKQHAGASYGVKPYREVHNYTAGVNPVAYYFQADDLRRFFEARGYRTTVIADEESKVTAGKFLRFLAQR